MRLRSLCSFNRCSSWLTSLWTLSSATNTGTISYTTWPHWSFWIFSCSSLRSAWRLDTLAVSATTNAATSALLKNAGKQDYSKSKQQLPLKPRWRKESRRYLRLARRRMSMTMKMRMNKVAKLASKLMRALCLTWRNRGRLQLCHKRLKKRSWVVMDRTTWQCLLSKMRCPNVQSLQTTSTR